MIANTPASAIASNISTDVVEIVNVEVDDDLVATSEDIEVLWKYFRIHDPQSVARFGPPLKNSSRDYIGDDLPKLSIRREMQYVILQQWFRQYIHMDSLYDESRVAILTIETPEGGLYIRSTTPADLTIHKFVTADLPPTEFAVSTAFFKSE